MIASDVATLSHYYCGRVYQMRATIMDENFPAFGASICHENYRLRAVIRHSPYSYQHPLEVRKLAIIILYKNSHKRTCIKKLQKYLSNKSEFAMSFKIQINLAKMTKKGNQSYYHSFLTTRKKWKSEKMVRISKCVMIEKS